MDHDRPEDWRELCKKAVNEKDPKKLMDLIVELNKALDERKKKQEKKVDEDAPDKNCLEGALRRAPALP
jgi:hypothetical protein